jgi:hypothetical protein
MPFHGESGVEDTEQKFADPVSISFRKAGVPRIDETAPHPVQG